MAIYLRRIADPFLAPYAIVTMAANFAPSFADVLAADSEFVMPTSDQDVQAALASFGAVYWKARGPAHTAERAELLASLALLHTHHLNLPPLLLL